MRPPYKVDERLRLHDLVHVTRHNRRAMFASAGEPSTDPLLVHWLGNDGPLVARRLAPRETHGVPVAVSLPVGARGRRLAIRVQPEQIVSISPPSTLAAASLCPPRARWLSLDRFAAGHSSREPRRRDADRTTSFPQGELPC